MNIIDIAREIEAKESLISEFQVEMAKEEVYSDYIKLGDYQEQLVELNKELEMLMLEWEELSLELE